MYIEESVSGGPCCEAECVLFGVKQVISGGLLFFWRDARSACMSLPEMGNELVLMTGM